MTKRIGSWWSRPCTSRILAIAALSPALTTPLLADYASEVLSENPIVYYRFDDGVTTPDLPSPAANLGSVGAAGNGIYGGTFVRGVAGALAAGSDTSVQGPGTLVSVANQAALNGTGSFTVEAWLKPTAIPAAGALISPLASFRENDAASYGRAGWLIYQGDSATGFNFRTYNRNGATIALSVNSGGAGIDAGTWCHVVAVWDSAAAVGKIYVNGVLRGTSTAVTPGGPNNSTYEPNNQAPLTMGSRSDGAFAWDGGIDEVAYYPAALSDAQILAHYTNGTSASPATTYSAAVLANNPAGYWRLGEAAFVPANRPADNLGTLAASGDGSYRLGAVNSSTGPSPASGFAGFPAGNSSLSLPDANGFVTANSSLLNNRSAFTVMGWVKRGAVKSTRGGYFGQNDVLEFGDAGEGTQIEAWSATSGQLLTTAPYPFADDQWGFITYVANGSRVELYLNGQSVTHADSAVTNYGQSAFPFNIGGGGVFAPTGDFFRGQIDEVAIFDKAVTPGRVRQLYDAALGNVPPDFVEAVPTVSPAGDITEGQPYTLSIDPTGSPPFTYEWSLNGVPIANSNSRTLTVPAAAPGASISDPLNYTVKVINGTSSKTSDVLAVYVNPVLRWTGTDATSPGVWNLNTGVRNWATFTTAVASAFDEDYAVLFDDSSNVTNVTLAEDVFPKAIVFNNATKNYVITGPLSLNASNGSGVTKTGAAKVTLNIDDLFVDKLEVKEGTLQLGSTMVTGIYTQTPVTVSGGTLEVALPTGTPYENNTALSAGGTLKITGTGNFLLNSGSNGITGAGNLTFDRSGTTRVAMRNTPGGTVTIASGTVVFDGSQDANRLQANSLITVNPGATMEMHGVNALPTGTDSVSATLNQSTLRVVTGGSESTGATGTSHGHLKNLNLAGATVTFSYSGQGGTYDGESFQLNGNIVVTGTAPSTITADSSTNAGSSGMAISNVAHTIEVADTGVGADLVIAAEIENADATGAASVVKTGAGTLQLPGGIAHSYSGSFQVDAGTLAADGSLAGPLVISAGAALAPGPSVATFTAGATTLNGTLRCELDGAASDRLTVNGDLTFGAGSVIDISVLTGGATAPVYQLASCSGSLSGPLPTLGGAAPPGYALEFLGGSLALVRADVDRSIVVSGVTPSGSEDFEATGGGFTVSAPVSPQVDWRYTGGSWFSLGANDGTGSGTNTSYLTSPTYTVTQAGPVVLTFSHKYDFEVDYDAGALEVSINGAAFTRVPGTAFTQNGYDGTLATGTNSALAGQEGFLATSDGYPAFFTSICTLAANASARDTVQVRFMSATDDALAIGGWEIDSVSVGNALPKLLKLEWPAGVIQYSDTLQPPWTDLRSGTPLLIDTKAAPRRFFRLKP